MRIALAEHTIVTYHTESELPNSQRKNAFDGLRTKFGFPAGNSTSYYRNKRKDHHTEHGVTTIVDLPAYEKTGNTFTPITARTSLTRDTRYTASSNGVRRNERGGGMHSTNSSTEDICIKDILAQMPTSPPASHHPRAITFDLPEGHALSSSKNTTSHTDKGDRLDPEMMGLNRRPNTGGSSTSNGVKVIKKDAPVLFVGENYHHRADVASATTSNNTGIVNLKNAITVTTEKIVKSEGGAQDEQ